MYRDLVLPSHKRICDHMAADGLAVTLHSDGDIRAFIPMFLEAGFRGLHPLEAKAGLHVEDLKARYGNRLVLHGNIDVRVLATTKEAIEKEIRDKLAVAKPGGGYLYHSDHSVPHDVSWENYAFAIEMVRRYGTYA
jgi:uroporphyrinogen decarboxylase